VAKIIGYKPACPDKDGDGTVETSTDTNGDGKISGAEKLPQGADECISFITFPGGWCQRAAGVDKENHVWVGDWDGQVLRRLEPTAGEVVQTIPIATNPYGLVIDQKGVIWVSGRGTSELVRVDPVTSEVKKYAPANNNGGWWWFEPYGITLDGKGRIWMADCCSNNLVHRFDPETETWEDVAAGFNPRGVVAAATGYTYVALDSSDSVAVIEQDTMAVVKTIPLGFSHFPVGITLDFKGFVWAVNQSGNSATKIDPVTYEKVGDYPVGMGPYTYSDMTGYQLYNYTAPMGEYVHTVKSLEGVTPTWALLNLDIGTPMGTSVDTWVRAGDSLADLESTAWGPALGPFPPTDLPVTLSPDLDGTMLQVRIRLYPGDEGVSPILKKIWVQYTI
jgi:streptogramin lyase